MILVTGGTGLTGAHLLLHLAKAGRKTRALYRSAENIAKTEHLFALYGQQGLFGSIEWVQGDILDIPSLDAAFAGVDQVYHCAAFVSFEPADEDQLRKVNIEGTANVVNCALHFGVKGFCHVSSIAALGDPREAETITEETDWNPEAPHSNYAISKYGAEMEVWRGWQEGLSTVIVNPGIIFGPGFWDSGSGKMFGAVHRGQHFYTNGTCGVVAVEDVVKIMVQLMESGISGERYTLVAGNVSYKQMLNTIADGMLKKRPSRYAPRLLTSIAWRTDWMLAKLMGRRRKLTRSMARSSHAIESYDNSKVIHLLNYRFTDVLPYLQRLAEGYRALWPHR